MRISPYQIGERIQNRWKIHDILRGGMGIVYVVYDHVRHDVYAVKTFQDEVFARDPSIVDRFTQEELVWINLDVHENITRAHHVEKIDGKPYLLLEYVSGGDLSQWIGTPRLTQDLAQVLRFAIQFCDGMTHALSKGIKAHCDIKPANCLLTELGTLKITDFGLARVFDNIPAIDWADWAAGEGVSLSSLNRSLTQANSLGGTCTHMAPEQFVHTAGVDVRADLYSFGVLLFEMVTGHLPFTVRAYTMQQAWKAYQKAHQEQPLPALKSGHPALDALVARCLSKDPKRRGESFTDLREELGRLYQHVTGETAPIARRGRELDAEEWSAKGQNLFDLAHFAEALSCLEESLKINPRNAAAWSVKGNIHNSMGQVVEALSCHKKAVELAPHSAVVWTNKGAFHKSTKEFAEALFCSERAIEINPLLAWAWLNKGAACHGMEQFADAMSCFEKTLKINPRLVEAWSNKGVLLVEGGQFADALSCFEKALEINPRDAETWFNMGILRERQHRPTEAFFCYEHALQSNPDFLRAWVRKGLLHQSLKQLAEALTCFNRALQINPQLGEAWFQRGTILFESGNSRDAISCFEQAQRLGVPHIAQLMELLRPTINSMEEAQPEVVEEAMEAWEWNNKGARLEQLGQRSEALFCYERALEIDPDDANIWNNKGYLIQSMGRNVESLSCYEHALKINPRLDKAWLNRGIVLAQTGQTTEALFCFERALECNPTYAKAWFNKGNILLGKGQTAEALPCYNRALELNPKEALAWYNKGSLLLNSGRLPEALACLEQAHQLGLPQAAAAHAAAAIAQCRRALGKK